MQRTIRKQFPTVVAQPVSLLAEIRTHLLDERPEVPRVIEMDEVTQLVDDDVGEDRARREREPPRKRERAPRRARAPTRARIADRDPATPNSNAGSLGGNGLPHELARNPPAFLFRQCRGVEHWDAFGVQLPSEPRGVRAQSSVDRTVAGSYGNDELGGLSGPPDGPQQPSAGRLPHVNLNQPSPDIDDPHLHEGTDAGGGLCPPGGEARRGQLRRRRGLTGEPRVSPVRR